MKYITIDEYFDEIYCINLRSRPERLLSFKKNFHNLGTSRITFFEAIDGSTLDIGDWKLTRGALGCTLSHVAIYKDALEKKHSKILVLEDDAVLGRNFRKALTKLIVTVKDEWDLLYLGGMHCMSPEKINSNVVKVKSSLTTHAIAINCECLPFVLAERDTSEIIDVTLAHLHQKLRVYAPTKFVAHQIKGYSDIKELYVDYNVSLFEKIFYKIKKTLTKRSI
jgi:GR25 family glycosyltransferase involved in LPS biosynthesis